MRRKLGWQRSRQCSMRRRFVLAALLSSLISMTGVLVAASPASANHYIGHHWAHNGLAHSQIYFVDHTGVKWPVSTVTYKWNQAQGVDSYYETSCPGSNLHCVNVREYNANDGLYGYTAFPNGWNASQHNREGVYVELNDHTVTTATQAHKTTCHELGHVLGLDHRSTNASCMTQGAAPPISVYPDSHDFAELQSIYNHAN